MTMNSNQIENKCFRIKWMDDIINCPKALRSNTVDMTHFLNRQIIWYGNSYPIHWMIPLIEFNAAEAVCMENIIINAVWLWL